MSGVVLTAGSVLRGDAAPRPTASCSWMPRRWS